MLKLRNLLKEAKRLRTSVGVLLPVSILYQVPVLYYTVQAKDQERITDAHNALVEGIKIFTLDPSSTFFVQAFAKVTVYLELYILYPF